VIGRTLSHYRILAEVSRGGMGIVYKALDTRLDREVALKVLPEDLVADPERRRRFEQEARAASKLEHPNIAVIHDIDEVDGVAFLTMELIRGEKLADRLLEGRLEWARSLEIATEIAEGLARAHERGVVHRDLKPANVMITEDGHPKIIDFGLAKLVGPLSGEGSEGATRSARDTEPGVVLGTVLYMSPEQARGGRVDPRTDVFSFGVVLFEMLSGRRPFDGASQFEILQAIVSAPTPRLDASLVGSASAGEVQRILDKCLAKDPAERYQSMKDLVVDLRSARRRLESSSVVTTISKPEPRSRGPRALVLVALLAAALVAGLLLRRTPPAPVPPTDASKPSLAVLRFENLSGDPSLDWLQTGLADMLITDLSQSTDLDVLSTDRLYQVLRDMKRLDERIESLEVVQDLAERGGVRTVLEGSFLKAGDSIRINVRIQDAATGRIVTSEKVEGIGEASLFEMVDDLSRRVRLKLDAVPSMGKELDRDLSEVTTASVDAYREYAEGINLQERTQYREAMTHFEEALRIDPGFAMAMAKLSVVQYNLANQQWVKSAERTLQHVDRLTPRERYYIEGVYYMRQERTFDRAIESYRKAVELYPNHASARNNLALVLGQFEQHEEARDQYQFLVDRGVRFVATQSNLANVLTELGEDEKALEILEKGVKANPDNSQMLAALGDQLSRTGREDEALEMFDRAQALDPRGFQPRMARVRAHLIRNDARAAEAAAREMGTIDDPFFQYIGPQFLALCLLQQGRSAEALSSAEEAERATGGTGQFSSRAHLLAAHIQLERGEAQRALAEANAARVASPGNYGEWAGLYFASLAEERLGNRREADRFAEELRTSAEALPTEKEKRRYRHLRGDLLLSRGDARGAIAVLEEAASTLSVHGIGSQTNLPQHVPIWFSLASAYYAAREDAKARQWFEKVASSRGERLYWAIPYVRSFYYLAKIEERQGDPVKARENFQRFFDFWREGDIDRALVEEARLALDASPR
jgi:serine/threonine protein kinase/Tfp pilus assembly protein PilF